MINESTYDGYVHEDLPRYKGVEQDKRVETPMGQGTVFKLVGIRALKLVRVDVYVDDIGMKRFNHDDVHLVVEKLDPPLPNPGLDALFAGIC